MPKTLFNIRLEKTKLERLTNIADQQNTNCSEIIRSKIDEIILNGFDEETKKKAVRMVKQLREPFAYVKSRQGISRAKQERETREKIANNIISLFHLENQKKLH